MLEKVLARQNLTQKEAREIMNQIMSGQFDDAQIAGFLIALRAKGETAEEIAGFAEAMREKMTPVSIASEAIDMCGTGGDARGTFNISTAAALVAAGAGVRVAKHGNRSMTSQSGSADVLSALGVDITMTPDKAARCVDEIGIGFMFAPAYHPAMKHVMGARKSLAVRTVFNILGPLCNPAGVKRQLMGIFDGNLIEKVAHVLKKLGATEALIVHGEDGTDEITTTTSTRASHLNSRGEIKLLEISPRDFGIDLASVSQLKGGNPAENAQIVKSVLTGKKGPHRDIVVLNAGAAIWVSGKTSSLKTGIALAEESIDSGSAMKILEKLARA